MQKQLKNNKNLNVTMIEKLKLLRFPSFRFGRIPKIENLEISEGFPLLQILTLVISEDLKQQKMNWDKSLKLLRFSSFRLGPLSWIDTGSNSRFKTEPCNNSRPFNKG